MSDFCLNTQVINNASKLCEDPDTKGFDLEAGQSWIYPTNYPVREYQYNIIQEALHKNTLVSLPTGLGKTFIAAVVMYNFYRWYPHGKVIFMAPTRPLVEQQIDACYNIMAIPQEVTAELTGVKKAQADREEMWQTKRVFFITPHVLQNDLEKVLELGNKIKCLVFDEAHKAKGNYAYCEVIRKLLPKNKLFRVLALSATPGNSVKDIGEVMQNLLISHLEFRNEESKDVKDYVFERSLETVVVPLGDKLQQIKQDYEQILEKYARTLIRYNVVHGNFSNLTKGRLHMLKMEFQARNRGSGTPHYAEIMKTLNICVTLYHGYEALIRCGLRIFLSYFEEHISNPLLTGNTALIRILEDLRGYLGPSPEVQTFPDGSFAPIPSSTKFGHPKFYRLRDILTSHFTNCDPSSRVIVFFEYKESVKEAYAILCQSYPTVKARIFVGQGAGVRQKDQIHTLKAFRQGTCNTLLSTCIGEEGLDVGEVDLIVCFDTTNKSPVRMIQRMGRTGRKKEGRIVVLVTEGKEQQTVKDSLICKNNLGAVMTNSSQLEAAKYKDSPSMIPSYVKPKCQKMYITVVKKPVGGKNGSLKDMFKSMSTGNMKIFDDVEIKEIEERIQNKAVFFWNKGNPLSFDFAQSRIDFSRHLEKQRAFQASGAIKQSKETEIFVNLLQSADSKRFNIPVTQTFSGFKAAVENKNLKQGDIRSMFSRCNPVEVVEETSVPISQISNFEKEKEITLSSCPEELFREISDYVSIRVSEEDECRICANLFECPKLCKIKSDPIDSSCWFQPDLSILDTITAQNLEIFADSLSPKSRELFECLENDFLDDFQFTQFEENEKEEIKKTEEKSFAYQTPKSFEKLRQSFRICEDDEIQEEVKKVEEKLEASKSEQTKVKKTASVEEILVFFKLSSIEDIFTENHKDKSMDLDKTVIYTPKKYISVSNNSPDIFDNSPDLFPQSEEKKEESPLPTIEEPNSPVLCSYEKSEKLKAKKKLFEESFVSPVAKRPNLSKLKLPHKSFYDSPRARKSSPEPTISSPKNFDLDIGDICDLSNFGLSSQTTSQKNEKKEEITKSSNEFDLDISDICNLSIFGLSKMDKTQKNEEKNKENEIEEKLKKSSEEAAELSVDNVCDISNFFADTKSKISDTKSVKNSSQHEPVKKSVQKELNVEDVFDFSEFVNQPKSKKHENSQKKTVATNKNDSVSDISDFCDVSYFLDSKDDNFEKKENKTSRKTETVKKPTQSEENLHKNNKLSDIVNVTDEDVFKTLKNSIIDLTDSPEKTNKTQTQLSITQMLSLIGKTEASNIQKENTTCSTPKPKKTISKSLLSLSNGKKGVLQLKQNVNSAKNTQSQKKTNETPKTKTKFNLSLTSNSDDEFEVSPIFAKPKPVVATNSVKKGQSKKPTLSLKKPKKLFSEFIEEEAELSQDVAVSEDEESEEDCFEASFVNDETQDFNTTDMHAQYLKTTKSPSIRGRFKLPDRPKHNVTNVFSQNVTNEDDTYLNDSFCVGTQDVDSPKRHELSELELLEMKLNKKPKKDKKRKFKEQNAINTNKRRRILTVNEDSD